MSNKADDIDGVLESYKLVDRDRDFSYLLLGLICVLGITLFIVFDNIRVVNQGANIKEKINKVVVESKYNIREYSEDSVSIRISIDKK